jgi:hypothetical protein
MDAAKGSQSETQLFDLDVGSSPHDVIDPAGG